jgi:hypothetical protein
VNVIIPFETEIQMRVYNFHSDQINSCPSSAGEEQKLVAIDRDEARRAVPGRSKDKDLDVGGSNCSS